ncbi:hypothetical protein [Nocardiopsis halotolerans]|uniref:hypothetical protein n=1 Tax=Nocardiopsis halotolerans TaxID=124252 RepID=UPI000348FAE4|nr:hypothetical protein [Nocardiopsis halotolerans]
MDRSLRGHAFLPPEPERASVPGEYGQDEVEPEEAVVHLHYFSPAADWWITELWQDSEQPGRWWAFGFARLLTDPNGGEWGRIDMTRLETLRVSRPGGPVRVVERDLAWRPVVARECVPGLP